MLRTDTRRAAFVMTTALLGAVVFSCPAAAAEKGIVIKSFSAPVEVKRVETPGKWNSAKVGMGLKAGDVIRTGKGAKALLVMGDGSKMALGSGSRMQVQEVAPNRIFGLDTGKVKSYIKKLRRDNKFEIKTPLAAASVRGTVFEVGFDEGKKEGYLDVDQGTVALEKEGQEILVNAGEHVGYTSDMPLTAPGSGEGEGSDAGEREAVRREVGLGMSKEEVMASAAEELRTAEYEEGKTLIDVFGQRVRLEEYIIRRPREVAEADRDKAFKLVVLNERAERFDYFYYRAVCNAALPDDLSAAFRDLGGKLGTAAPTYYVSSYEKGFSNTQDSMLDTASGGHLVTVTFDGTNYTLTDPTSAANTRTVAADEPFVQNGVTYHKVYDPVNDKFMNLDAAQMAAFQPTVYNPENDRFEVFSAGSTYWRGSFDSYVHAINGAEKQRYTASSSAHVLALDLDATARYLGAVGGTMRAVTDEPSGGDFVHSRTTLYYSDGTTETYNTYIIDDAGKIAAKSVFSGVTTGQAYKTELLNWNYEQVIEASEFQGRKIDLVVEPKIMIESGLIK